MSFIDTTYVKEKFPLWDKYFLDENGDESDTVLTDEIDNSEAEISRYVTLTEDDITDADKLDILTIVKKRGFDRRHGDEEFENKPQIIKDYEKLIKRLEENVSYGDNVSIESKARRFGDRWFNDSADDLSSTSN